MAGGAARQRHKELQKDANGDAIQNGAKESCSGDSKGWDDECAIVHRDRAVSVTSLSQMVFAGIAG